MNASNNKNLCVEEYVDTFIAENCALHRKLQSKAEALLIVSKELDQCRTERDQLKLMAEQLQDRCAALKRISQDMGADTRIWPVDGCEGRSLAQVLGETKEMNKSLRLEVEDLRQKLRDAEGDIKVLRWRGERGRSASVDDHSFPSHQREELVQQLETISMKCGQLEADLQAVLDEKEELVTERDAYKCKAHRLNHQLHTLLRGDCASSRVLDVDALVMENRYLQERLQQSQEENHMVSEALVKYKSMLETKRSKGAIKLGTSSSAGLVMSHKQVQQLLERGTASQLPNTAATLGHMKSLCLGLLDALSDKTLALCHQRKANKILAGRVTELEHMLQECHVGAFPSQLLLDGYPSSEVDRHCTTLLGESPRHPAGESCALGKKEQPQQQVSPRTDSSDANTDTSLSTPSNKTASSTLGEDSLPLELQELVQKALRDLQEKMQASTSAR